jgi:hypothetical protein
MRVLMVAALMAPLAACSTMTRSSTQAFTVESEPSGAAVSTSTGLTCAATPCTFESMPRNADFTVTVSMPGYETVTQEVTHQTAGGGRVLKTGNAIYGRVVGLAFDSREAATQDLTPNPLRVTLAATPVPPTDAAAAPATADAPPPTQ